MGHHNLLFVTDNSRFGGPCGRGCRSHGCNTVTQEQIEVPVAEVLPGVAIRNAICKVSGGS
jgi:hypothetical protein